MMNISKKIVLLLAMVTLLPTSPAWPRGGRMGGGGARMGGGGARMGGGGGARSMGHMGGAARTPSMSRTMSRPAMPTTRPAMSRPASRPQVNPVQGREPNVSRPNLNRPNMGNNRPGMNRPGAPTTRPGSSGRPSAGELNDFLGMHGGNRPTTLPGTAVRPGSNRPGPGNRPGNGNRPNFDRPNISNRPNIGNRPNVGNRVNAGNRVNIGNQVNIDRRNNFNSIRNHWSRPGNRPFDRNWWGRYPTTLPAWRWHRPWNRYPGSWYWRHAGWATFGTWFAWNWATPVAYDYGSSVVYRDNYVYVNDEQVATAQEYYQQADTIANSIPEDIQPEQVEWMPLGVFAIAEDGGVDTGMLIQLAVSKEGIIAGTFYNDLTDDGRPLEGTVDRQSQRAAWRFADGKNSDVVMEAPIYNLTQDESTALVHFGAESTQTWLMVRLPEEDSNRQSKPANQ